MKALVFSAAMQQPLKWLKPGSLYLQATGTDAELEAALEVADLPVILSVLYQLTS